MELPNPPWYRRWSIILAAVVGLAAITAMLGLRGLQEVADPSTTAAATAPTTTVATATTTTPSSTRDLQTTTVTRSPNLLWTETGKNLSAGKSPGFRAPAAWHIEWSFDCANFRKYGGGNFKITGDGAFEGIQIQEFDLEASGSRTFSKGGYGHLLVESVCQRWTVTALVG